MATGRRGTHGQGPADDSYRIQLIANASLPSDEVADAKRNAEAKVAGMVGRFLTPYGLSFQADTVYLLSNELGPGVAVSELAKREQVDLVVMGTTARTGVKGALIGNTAEQGIDRIECSVRAVKPDNFVSPVTLPEP